MSTLSNYVGSETVICQLQALKTAFIKFGDYIIITASKNRTPVCILDRGYKILNKKIER